MGFSREPCRSEGDFGLFSGAGRTWLVLLFVVGGLSLGSGSIAASPAATSSRIDVGLARVVARPDQPVHFLQLLEYDCQPGLECSDKDVFVVNGDRVVTGGEEGERVYVWFRGRGRSMRGWLPAAHVVNLPLDTNPTLEKWEGAWTVGELRQIVIAVDPMTRQLTITATAKWFGRQLENGDPVIHTGGVHGKVSPDGNRLIIRGDDSECVFELELVDEFLVAEDNMHCGGMNVSFGDVYTREAGTEKSPGKPRGTTH